MYCPNCKKDVLVVSKPVDSKTQYNCKECGVAINLLPGEPELKYANPPTSPEPIMIDIEPVEDVIGYACDFGKYKGEPFESIPTSYLIKHVLPKYKRNKDVTAAINAIIAKRGGVNG